MLAANCDSPLDTARLRYLSSLSGRHVFKQLIEEQRPSLLELLKMFPSCRPPLANLLNSLPKLVPRMYSIANSPLGPGGCATIRIVFKVVEDEIALPEKVEAQQGKRVVHGICTHWLENLALGLHQGRKEVDIFFRATNSFHPPGNVALPVVMIGPGTGVAPFIGFVEHRKILKQEIAADDYGELYAGVWRGRKVTATDFENLEREHRDIPTAEFGEMWLYFGCRKRTEDFLFKDFLGNEAAAEDGALQVLRTAFSREQATKVYVQDLLREDGAALADLILNQGCYIFLCGDGVSMAKAVHQAIVDLISKHGLMTQKQAQAVVEDLAKRNRFCKDIW